MKWRDFLSGRFIVGSFGMSREQAKEEAAAADRKIKDALSDAGHTTIFEGHVTINEGDEDE